ncbi:MAG TPA: hypothetical protein VGR70_07485 [Stellaceae bacterium]|nr:hypothetical protein [Stellaceae bacterium]
MSSEQTNHRPLASALTQAPTALRLWLPSWPWFLGLVAVIRALTSPAALLHDPDTYLHIAAGRWMLAHHALPVADVWSHTMPGAPWIPAEWLGEVVLAAIYNAAGWGGVVVMIASAFALATGFLAWFLLLRLPPLPAAIATLAGAMLVLPHLLARPHVLALPALVCWCGVLIAARDEERGPPWAVLPVMALWANLHGSFMFGLGLAGFLGAEAMLHPGAGQSRLAEVKRWGLFVAGAIAAALCNPNGLSALLQPLRLVAMPALQTGFVEWAPAELAKFPALEAWLLGAIALGFTLRTSLPWSRLLLLLGLFYMALAHVRHADLLGLVAPIAVAAAFGPALVRLLRPAAGSPISRAATALARPARPPAYALVLVLGFAASLPALLHPPARTGDAVTPQAALAAAQRLGLAGPVFNGEAYGGYLIFSGVPVFIDGRIEMYGNDFLAAYIAAEQGDAGALAALLDRYRIAWTLLPAQSPAIAALDRLPGWRRAYTDDQAVINVPIN